MSEGGPSIEGVLFDLDGTLVDSAADLARAVNRLRADHGLPALPLAQLRPMVGAGARGMIGAAFGVTPSEPKFEALRSAFLAYYEADLLQTTHIFEGIEHLLYTLEHTHIPWGIVTNKAMRFATPIVSGLGLAARAAVIICGDTTAHAKPHPEPLWAAARAMKLAPQNMVYIGDDHRDAQAAQAAGMSMIAATWGYLGNGEPVEAWPVSAQAAHPADVLAWLSPHLAVTSGALSQIAKKTK